MPFTKHEPPETFKRCSSSQHKPPGMIVLEPGTHTYECPKCGKTTVIVVPEVSCDNGRVWKSVGDSRLRPEHMES